MRLAEAIRAGEAMGLARLDAQLLLLHALGRAQHDRGWLLAHDADALDAHDEAHFLMACRRRHAGEPLAYIVGSKEFYGLELAVTPDVLVPRPDTETLVEWALAVLGCADAHRQPTNADASAASTSAGDAPITSNAAQSAANAANAARAASTFRRLAVTEGNPSVIDLGTGSGAIALAIKRHCPAAEVEAVDSSLAALHVARSNAHRLAPDVAFRLASWLDGAATYDLIVSNPPYIPEADPHLDALAHEPQTALRAGPDGLGDIRAIVSQAPAHLNRGGWLLLEHGWDQASAVRDLLTAAGFASVQSRRDLAGIERCSGGRFVERG